MADPTEVAEATQVPAANPLLPPPVQAYTPPEPKPEAPPAQEVIPTSPAPNGTQLPLIYHAAAQARANGYSWDEINDKFTAARGAAKDAGYTDGEVDTAFGITPTMSKEPPPPSLGGLNLHPDTADNIRGFANTYLTPDLDQPVAKTTGQFFSMIGHDVLDVGKILGGGVVNGVAAIFEGLDGKARSVAEQTALGVEAQGFLSLLAAPDMAGGPRVGPAPVGLEALKAKIPPVQEFVDGATAIAVHHPDGISGALTGAARALGQNFVETGERPLAAAARAVNDPDVMKAFHDHMDYNARQLAPEVFEQADAIQAQIARYQDSIQRGVQVEAVQKALTAAQGELDDLAPALNKARRAAVEQTTVPAEAGGFGGVEQPSPTTLTLDYADQLSHTEVLSSDALAEEGKLAAQQPGLVPLEGDLKPATNPAGVSPIGTQPGLPPPPPNTGLTINAETIGQKSLDPNKTLLTSLRLTLGVQGLDRAGAGMLRHAFSQTATKLLRSSQNLRRFGRSIGNMSSAARRDWWHAYEGGEQVPFQSTTFEGQVQEMGQRAGLPKDVSIKVEPVPQNTPGQTTSGFYRASTKEIVIDPSADHATASHEIFHALYDPANNLLTAEQRTIIEARANRWLNQKAANGDTNREYLKSLGYPDAQLTEEAGARLIGENPKVTNARDAMARYPVGSDQHTMGLEFRKEFDRRYTRMLELGIAPNYIDGYLARMYQNPAGAMRIWGNRGLGGTGTHMRQRVFEFLQDAEAAGMKLATDNPVESALARLHDMDKLIMKHEIAGEMNANGMGSFYKPGDTIPEGLTKIPGITLPGETGTFYGHTPTALMINRHLSSGVAGTTIAPIYDVIRQATSTYTSVKLTMSMYHPVVLAANSFFSAIATGMVQASRGGFGNVLGGLGKIAKSPIAPVEDFILGKKLNNYARTAESNDFRLTNMFSSLEAGGARFGSSEAMHSTAAGSFWRNIHGSLVPESGLTTLPQEIAGVFRNAPPLTVRGVPIAPGYIRAMYHVALRTLDSMSGIIMDGFVPAMKSGASARMMQEALDANPNMGLADIRRVAGRISDATDNRIGEVVQDNQFWNKWIHDVNNVLFMAPSWFQGKLRLGSTAAADALKGGYMDGALSHNIAYPIAAIAGTMMMGALWGAAKGTWNADWTLYDYYHPPTGGTNADGSPERMDFPTPIKDAYGWLYHPEQELENKFNGAYGMIQDLAHNRQYGGKAAITDPSAPIGTNIHDYGHELAKQLAPIITQRPQSKESNINLVEQFLGLRPAPMEISNPEKVEGYERKATAKAVKAKNRKDAAEAE